MIMGAGGAFLDWLAAAAAINRDGLTAEYALPLSEMTNVTTLASRNDRTLELAFPVGDLIADVLQTDHAAVPPSLGYDVPIRSPAHRCGRRRFPIIDVPAYGIPTRSIGGSKLSAAA